MAALKTAEPEDSAKSLTDYMVTYYHCQEGITAETQRASRDDKDNARAGKSTGPRVDGAASETRLLVP